MSVNVLIEKADEPTDARLRTALGQTWGLFEALRTLTTASCELDWRHYGKKYGWKLKVHADDKTLLELTVADGWFLVAMAIREKERQELKTDPAAAALAEVPDAASPEGYGIKIEIRDAASAARAMGLVRFIMSKRSLS